jgi:hypothetical protein
LNDEPKKKEEKQEERKIKKEGEQTFRDGRFCVLFLKAIRAEVRIVLDAVGAEYRGGRRRTDLTQTERNNVMWRTGSRE